MFTAKDAKKLTREAIDEKERAKKAWLDSVDFMAIYMIGNMVKEAAKDGKSFATYHGELSAPTVAYLHQHGGYTVGYSSSYGLHYILWDNVEEYKESFSNAHKNIVWKT